MYKIIGADKKEYGPISADIIRQWIAEGRVNANTQARVEGSEQWLPLSAFADFANALGISTTPPTFSAGAQAPLAEPIEQVLARDYQLDIGACISKAWNLMSANMGMIIGGVLIYFAIELGIGVLGMIPLIGPVFSLGNLVIVGPLEAGVFYLLLNVIRRQPANAGDVFEGFRRCFGQLFLGKLVSGLLAGLCMIPAVIVAAFVLFVPMALHHQQQPTPAQIIIVVAAFLVCMIPTVVLQINWIFTLPLIIDRRMSFWPAMQASWKMVTKHWWQIFGLFILVALLNVVGMILCCVGLLFTIPVGFGALMYAYETIFSARGPELR
jgi:uncharacterized membrane protein